MKGFLMNTKYMVIILLGLTASACAKTESPLRNAALESIDGMPGMMDGKNISMVVHVVRENIGMLYGDIAPGCKKRVGRFSFNGAKHSIQTLARLERNNKGDAQLETQLQEMLAFVKGEFAKVMEPFMQQGRGAKSFTIQLMQEWAENHNRTNSFLLTWGNQPENKELEIFNNEIVTFVALEKFCADLISFLDDMMRSCPLGWKQYEELLSKLHS
jgi:hypothetical protein